MARKNRFGKFVMLVVNEIAPFEPALFVVRFVHVTRFVDAWMR
jgi:hypothetical protein